jgi:hypothetical protein
MTVPKNVEKPFVESVEAISIGILWKSPQFSNPDHAHRLFVRIELLSVM